jgi:hypothetical protein
MFILLSTLTLMMALEQLHILASELAKDISNESGLTPDRHRSVLVVRKM